MSDLRPFSVSSPPSQKCRNSKLRVSTSRVDEVHSFCLCSEMFALNMSGEMHMQRRDEVFGCIPHVRGSHVSKGTESQYGNQVRHCWTYSVAWRRL